MSNLANVVFLLAAVSHMLLGYKTGWAIYADIPYLSPTQQALYPVAWKISIASLVLSFASILGLIVSFTYHAVYGVGPETALVFLPVAVLLLCATAAFWFILRKM